MFQCHMNFSREERGLSFICFPITLETRGASAETKPFSRTSTFFLLLKDISKSLLQKAHQGLTDINESLISNGKEKLQC